jgi:hypothetical protein
VSDALSLSSRSAHGNKAGFENPAVLALQLMWFRNHNYHADRLNKLYGAGHGHVAANVTWPATANTTGNVSTSAGPTLGGSNSGDSSSISHSSAMSSSAMSSIMSSTDDGAKLNARMDDMDYWTDERLFLEARKWNVGKQPRNDTRTR